MIKIKVKDLELAMDYIKKNGFSEYVELDPSETQNTAISISFTNKLQRPCKIFLYVGEKNITPEVRETTKLYKTE